MNTLKYQELRRKIVLSWSIKNIIEACVRLGSFADGIDYGILVVSLLGITAKFVKDNFFGQKLRVVI